MGVLVTTKERHVRKASDRLRRALMRSDEPGDELLLDALRLLILWTRQPR